MHLMHAALRLANTPIAKTETELDRSDKKIYHRRYPGMALFVHHVVVGERPSKIQAEGNTDNRGRIPVSTQPIKRIHFSCTAIHELDRGSHVKGVGPPFICLRGDINIALAFCGLPARRLYGRKRFSRFGLFQRTIAR